MQCSRELLDFNPLDGQLRIIFNLTEEEVGMECCGFSFLKHIVTIGYMPLEICFIIYYVMERSKVKWSTRTPTQFTAHISLTYSLIPVALPIYMGLDILNNPSPGCSGFGSSTNIYTYTFTYVVRTPTKGIFSLFNITK